MNANKEEDHRRDAEKKISDCSFLFALICVNSRTIQGLRQDLFHHLPMHIGQPALDAVVIEGQALVVDA